jgi:hypothetical protein
LPEYGLWLEKAPVRQFGRFAAFLSRGVLGGYPPADWREILYDWRIPAVQLRIEADLRTHQSALADIYLALPPRWLLPSVILLLIWLLGIGCSLLRIIKILYSTFG